MSEKGSEYKMLVGDIVGKRSLGKGRCRWKDNTKIYITKIGWEGVDWITLTLDGQMAGYRVMKFWVP
jgi:hypothetical protein